MSDPFQPVPRVAVSLRGRGTFDLYKYDFPGRPPLQSALDWTLKNSLTTQKRTVAGKNKMPTTKIETVFREVILIWLLKRKKFVAYTLGQTAAVYYDPRISVSELIVVAHTHPTKKEVPWLKGHTTRPSPDDARKLAPGQTYSIVLHRDLAKGKIPCGFIYSRQGLLKKNVYVNQLRKTATDFIALESAARTSGRFVGRYR